MTKTILCYGDSNTWGWNPSTWERYPRDARWPGVMRLALGEGYEVIEEGLNGRTTVWPDPIEGFKSGKAYLVPCLETHRPIDLVIIMLGTNDLKMRFSLSAFDIAEGAGALVRIVQSSAAGRDGAAPSVLLVAPPSLGQLSDFADMFAGGVEKSHNFAEQFARVADLLGCHFLDAGKAAVSSDVDGVHLAVEEHEKLGEAMASMVSQIL